MPDSAEAFARARDVLLRHRTDLAAASAEFRWPALGRFNWALDHFDRIAAGNEQPALRILGPQDRNFDLLRRALRPLRPGRQLVAQPSALVAATASWCCSATSSRSGR